MKRKMKKILSGLLCVAVALMPAAKVWATDVEEEAKKAYELPEIGRASCRERVSSPV